MNGLVFYFICVGIMTILCFLKTLAEIKEFKKKYPNHIAQKQCWESTLCDFLKVVIILSIPILNVIIFYIVFCVLDKNTWEDIILKNTISLD
jgi:hypothetical protein